MAEVSVRLVFEKSTPGTHFYSTKDQTASIRSVYVRKDSPIFKDGKPETILIVVSDEQ